jgi:hypothetical protein
MRMPAASEQVMKLNPMTLVVWAIVGVLLVAAVVWSALSAVIMWVTRD